MILIFGCFKTVKLEHEEIYNHGVSLGKYIHNLCQSLTCVCLTFLLAHTHKLILTTSENKTLLCPLNNSN